MTQRRSLAGHPWPRPAWRIPSRRPVRLATTWTRT